MPGREIVTAPNGERWRVGRRWLDRPAPKLWKRDRKRKDGEDGGGWLDLLAPFDVADGSLAGIALGLAVIVGVALVVFVLLPLIGIALELALLVLLVSSGLFGRVVLRKPWTVEAVSLDRPQERVAFAVRGWRRSGRAAQALASAIATTGPPSALPEAEPVAAGQASLS